jgi:hypothetical protein
MLNWLEYFVKKTPEILGPNAGRKDAPQDK